MRRRKAQKKLKRRSLTVCQRCPFTPYNPPWETKPWNMRAKLDNEDGTPRGWVVVKTCLECGDKVVLR